VAAVLAVVSEILTRLGLDLPERLGTDAVHLPGVVQTRP